MSMVSKAPFCGDNFLLREDRSTHSMSIISMAIQPVSSIYTWIESSSGRRFYSLSVVSVCAVNTKLARIVPKFRTLISI